MSDLAEHIIDHEAILEATATVAAPTTIYVAHDGLDSNDGLTIGTAKATLEGAAALIPEFGSPTTIWVDGMCELGVDTTCDLSEKQGEVIIQGYNEPTVVATYDTTTLNGSGIPNYTPVNANVQFTIFTAEPIVGGVTTEVLIERPDYIGAKFNIDGDYSLTVYGSSGNNTGKLRDNGNNTWSLVTDYTTFDYDMPSGSRGINQSVTELVGNSLSFVEPAIADNLYSLVAFSIATDSLVGKLLINTTTGKKAFIYANDNSVFYLSSTEPVAGGNTDVFTICDMVDGFNFGDSAVRESNYITCGANVTFNQIKVKKVLRNKRNFGLYTTGLLNLNDFYVDYYEAGMLGDYAAITAWAEGASCVVTTNNFMYYGNGANEDWNCASDGFKITNSATLNLRDAAQRGGEYLVSNYGGLVNLFGVVAEADYEDPTSPGDQWMWNSMFRQQQAGKIFGQTSSQVYGTWLYKIYTSNNALCIAMGASPPIERMSRGFSSVPAFGWTTYMGEAELDYTKVDLKNEAAFLEQKSLQWNSMDLHTWSTPATVNTVYHTYFADSSYGNVELNLTDLGLYGYEITVVHWSGAGTCTINGIINGVDGAHLVDPGDSITLQCYAADWRIT